MADQTDDVHDHTELIDESGSSSPADETDAQQQAAEAQWMQLEAKMRHGANWYYWIAGLSVINSAILLSEGATQFLAGLGVTQFANAIALHLSKQSPDNAIIFKAIAGVFTLMVAAVVLAFGYGSSRRSSTIFLIGMLLYTIDGLIYILFEDWLSIAFHVFVLTRLFSGFQACRQLNAAEALVAQEI